MRELLHAILLQNQRTHRFTIRDIHSTFEPSDIKSQALSSVGEYTLDPWRLLIKPPKIRKEGAGVAMQNPPKKGRDSVSISCK